MTKKNSRKPADRQNVRHQGKSKTPLWQALAIILAAPLVFILLLEGGLALFGVTPVLSKADPFVGFTGNVPLFVEKRLPNGRTLHTTSSSKLSHFNRQTFPADKAANSYRIFTLGGSTTYGRPYDDLTSFSGWLRELLPATATDREWEVINAGGISYASYRVARLMEELVEYQPDLFIIYTGQNEFLEERTYRELKQLPEIVRNTVGLLAQTRTWAAGEQLLQVTGLVAERQTPQANRLPGEVNAILDNATGPADYQRDDQLRQGVLEHFRLSLERIADIARSADADVIFVTPASNLKDCSPFKSEHGATLSGVERRKVSRLLAIARQLIATERWQPALATLENALTLDPRYAELSYLQGKALFALKRFEQAQQAFQRARDEDVCPLRALTPMPDILAAVARKKDLPLVDFAELVEQRFLRQEGHSIPGEELFLDHVHPTIEGHKILAVALVEKMIAQGLVPDESWGEAVIETATEQIEERIDPLFQAESLVNLAKVLHWAGKMEDARRSAEKAIKVARGDPQLTAQATNVLIKIVKARGNQEQLGQYLEQALQIAPWSPMMHYHLGVQLLQDEQRHKGAAHVLLATAFWDTNRTNSMLGLILYKNNRFDLAYPLLAKALRQKPEDRITAVALNTLQQQLGENAAKLPPVKIKVQRYSSGAPREIYIVASNSRRTMVPDGMVAEWHENGKLKKYKEVRKGKPYGLSIEWNLQGQEIERHSYQNGLPPS